MDKSAQRAVFEEWMDDGFQCTLKRDKDGNYIDRETYAAWEAWQAATEQASQSQWIPVNERLPEEAAPVLVPYHPIPIVAYWDRGPNLKVRWWMYGVPNGAIETRYWMPLPSQSGLK